MRFVRVHGRVVPIRDSAEKNQRYQRGLKVQAAGMNLVTGAAVATIAQPHLSKVADKLAVKSFKHGTAADVARGLGKKGTASWHLKRQDALMSAAVSAMKTSKALGTTGKILGGAGAAALAVGIGMTFHRIKGSKKT